MTNAEVKVKMVKMIALLTSIDKQLKSNAQRQIKRDNATIRFAQKTLQVIAQEKPEPKKQFRDLSEALDEFSKA